MRVDLKLLSVLCNSWFSLYIQTRACEKGTQFSKISVVLLKFRQHTQTVNSSMLSCDFGYPYIRIIWKARPILKPERKFWISSVRRTGFRIFLFQRSLNHFLYPSSCFSYDKCLYDRPFNAFSPTLSGQ